MDDNCTLLLILDQLQIPIHCIQIHIHFVTSHHPPLPQPVTRVGIVFLNSCHYKFDLAANLSYSRACRALRILDKYIECDICVYVNNVSAFPGFVIATSAIGK